MFNKKGADKRAPEKRASSRDRHRGSDGNRGSGTRGSTSERTKGSDRNGGYETSRRERNASSPSRRETSGRSTRGSLGIESQMERLVLTDDSRLSLKGYKGKSLAQYLTQIARSHKPKKMDIYYSSPRRRRKLATSYMSSSNPQRLAPALPTQSQGVQFLAIEMYGVRLHMMAHIRFNIPSSAPGMAQAEGPGVIDTGTRFILADRSQFDPRQLAQYQVDNQGQPVVMDQAHPSSGTTLRGVLHQSGVRVGYAHNISLQAQRFYVTQDPTQQLEQRIIGIGPVDSPHYMSAESISYRACPSLLETIRNEYRLELVLGIYVSLWNEDPNDPDIMYGLIHFGGVDASLYVGEPLWVERARDPIAAHHYGVYTTMRYGGQDIRGRERRLAILDTGAPGIHLAQRIFDSWINMLRAAGVDVIAPQNILEPWLIPEHQIEAMRDLTLYFTDVTDQEFRVRIPVDRLLYPSKVSALFGTVPQGNIALAVFPHQHQGGSDIILGLPFFQERYTIANMAANRHYIGFGRMQQSEQKSPEFERIRAAVRQWQQQQQQLQQQQGTSSDKGKGRDYGGDRHGHGHGGHEHRKRRP